MNKILILLGFCVLFGAGCKITRQGYQFIISSEGGDTVIEGTRSRMDLQSSSAPTLSVTPDGGFVSGSFVLPSP